MKTDTCYCGENVSKLQEHVLQCTICKKKFHFECLKTGRPTPLEGDTFFALTCQECSDTGEERCTRQKLQWTQVVVLALYNLQLQGAGKCGYFRWKEHICAFIDKHWIHLFDASKKKTSTWHGTVAGALSAGCPKYFVSGQLELKESGWWKLTEMKPLSLDQESGQRHGKKQKLDSKESLAVKMEGLRTRARKTSIQAAIELKARRSVTQEAKDIRKTRSSTDSGTDFTMDVDKPISNMTVPQPPVLRTGRTTRSSSAVPSAQGAASEEMDVMADSQQDALDAMGKGSWFTEKDLKPPETVPQLLLMEDEALEDDSDFEIDPGSISPPRDEDTLMMDNTPDVVDILSALQHTDAVELNSTAMATVTKTVNTESETNFQGREEEEEEGQEEVQLAENKENEEDESDVESSENEHDAASESSDNSSVNENQNKPLKKENEITEVPPESKPPDPVYEPMSVYEEKRLLKKLNSIGSGVELDSETKRFRAKLRVRQLKRERGLPIFDLDATMAMLTGQRRDLELNYQMNPSHLPTSRFGYADYRVLDRFQMPSHSLPSQVPHFSSFLNRLVGTEDDQLQSICSPYTARFLKPFIRRDYESVSLKMKLFQEIISFPHRDDPSWEPPVLPPIDYCYVRPQHIPSVNALCREFFWPGIDLSECLQYPDFSCVVLYRKIVIGFAFMVPDVKYNEAYISFIFTHPEWRRCGIATFMLYHLIQTCMGKDVTLHVSATNAAMLLYQKFGFKPEEFILDFYDKYYPEDSKDCKHAFFLRLRR
ncbi:cysteine-rich protein 2-binding protein isoform X2 [Lingula anatina]|nr:cysteine-rich protein 2-binding protein isoform X2 [Lingula anatina]|eukprot:XP_013398059.1 cysteine-rich protein 2-binding protein isoform X2 [Lingula anatina]